MTPSAPAPPAFRFEHLYVETSGPAAAPPLLFLHGWGSSAHLMRPLARHLDEAFHIYNVDLPGHGHAPPPPAPWGLPEHAALLARLIRERLLAESAAEQAAIVGHSNGGRLALYLASDPVYKNLIRRLVLISPSGMRPERPAGVRLKAGLAKVLKAPVQALPDPPRAFLLDWLRHSLLWKALGSSDYRTLQGVMRETFVKTVNYHLEERLKNINAPTLVFWGTDDTAVSRLQMQVLEEEIPNAGLVVLDGAGHYGHLDALDTVATATRHFLENTSPRDKSEILNPKS